MNGHYYCKETWKTIVWENAWRKEDNDVNIMYKQPYVKYFMFDIIEKPFYLMWWIISSDNYPKKMCVCEKLHPWYVGEVP